MCMNWLTTFGPLGEDRTQRDETGGHVARFQLSTVDDIVVTHEGGTGVLRRRDRRDIVADFTERTHPISTKGPLPKSKLKMSRERRRFE